MAQVHDSLSELFEHGSLPFTGRAHELQLIQDFWKSTFLAERLRALVITGEAGSGKSRLLEATIATVAEQGGVVAHIKLYHDATAAIAPLVLEALRASDLFHHVSRSGSGTPLSMAAQALRQIARLRPLLLVIEDIQLLEGDALQELNQLLEMLADEPISAIFATRPVKQRARGIVERHLVEEITLTGLRREEIGELWESVIGAPACGEIVDLLYGATLGNPLALRSALREALKEEQSLASTREATAPAERLRHLLEHRVGLLAEGMVAHLDASELHAATMLASVGEVFAREAASTILEGSSELLETLQAKGIISFLSTPALPISAATSRFPLFIFSHSLIHKHLINREMTAPELLLRLIASAPPLYSLLPFQLLLRCDAAALPPIGFEMLRTILQSTDTIVGKTSDGPDWRQGLVICELTEKLAEAAALTPEQRLEAEVDLCHQRLSMFRRELIPSSEYEACVARFIELTENPSTMRQAQRRICALDNLMAIDDTTNNTGTNVEFSWEEAERVVERFPSIVITRRYIFFLSALSIYGRAVYNSSLQRRIAEKMALIEHSSDISDGDRRFAWRKLSPILLRDFSTPEELETRLKLMTELDRETNIEDWLFMMEKLLLLETIGEMDAVLKTVDRWNTQLVARGLLRSARSCSFVKLRALASLGEPLPAIEEEMAQRVAHPFPLSSPHRARFGRSFAQTGLLCGDLPWVRKVIQEYPECEPIISPEVRIALALERTEYAQLASLLEQPQREIPPSFDETTYFSAPDPEIAILVKALLDGERADRAMIAEAVARIAGAHHLRITDLLRIHTMLALVAAIDRETPGLALLAALKPTLVKSLQAALEWAAVRRLPPPMAMLLKNHGELLTQRQRTLWNHRLATIAEERRESLTSDGARPPLAISMIGTISFSKQSMAPHRIRGERMRVLLALMVANVLIAQPLSQEEFAAIATGIEDDPEAARLSLTHMVYRLRETIGTQAVITSHAAGSNAAPQLNLAVVDVDLVRAWRALQTAHDSLHEGFLAKAAHALTEAMETVGSEIIFPTLYDPFFEALRTDFEVRLRQLILAIAGRLAEEGDREGGVALMERGFAMMPDDEEIAERLHHTLVELGRNAEAVRVRSRSARR